MSGQNADVSLAIKVVDQASPAIEKAAARAAAAQKTVADAASRSASRQRSEYDKLGRAREMLGVRSEQRIQREIAATQSAYQRLAASGRLTALEMGRAFDATTARVTRLTNEMGRMTAAQEKAQKAAASSERRQAALQVGGMAIAGAVGGYAAVRGSVSHAMSVDERLAYMANTAYGERDERGWKVGKEDLRRAVDSSVDRYGGTRDAATGALEEIIGSNAMSTADAMRTLPEIMKASTASGASPQEMAKIAIRAQQNFRIDPKEMGNVLNMALAAGKAGGFELKDMAKHLPTQMGMATQSGMSGRAGFAKLAALNQVAAITAGTKDEAGNNVVNLLQKISEMGTSKDVGKALGIDLHGYLQQRRAKGVDSVDAFAELVSKTVSGRKDYQALQKQLAGAKNDDEKRATLESMTAIAQGAGVGTLIQDRQAMMALVALMNNKDYMQTVLAKTRANDRASGGAVDIDFGRVSQGGAFANRRRQENVEAAKDRAVGDGGSVLSAFNDGLANLYAKFPEFTGSLHMAGAALLGLATAAGLASVAVGGRGVLGKAAAGAKALSTTVATGAKVAGARVAGAVGLGAAAAGAGAKIAGAGAAGTGAVLGGAAGGARRVLGMVGKGGAVGLAAAGGGMLLGHLAGEDSALARYGSGMLEGAGWGATVGSAVPVIGTAVGTAVGLIGGALVTWLTGAPKPEPPKMQGQIYVTVSDDRIKVAQKMQATGMEGRMSTGTSGASTLGNFNTGAP